MNVDTRLDQMTGLLSRRAFLAAVDEQLVPHKALSVALLDINDFLRVNDALGSGAGDRVLTTLAQYLHAEAAANGWVVGRIGGDEFAILMPMVPLEKAFLAMEAMRAHLASDSFFQTLGDMGPIETFGVCVGLASAPRDARETGALMRMADEAVFTAKEGDRQTVCLPSNQDMVLKSCHYSATQLRRLKALAERVGYKESELLREALDDLLKKHDVR